MKILMIVHHAKVLTGFRYELLKTIVKSQNEVIAVAPESADEISEKMAKIGVRYIPICYERSSINPVKEIGVVLQIISIIKKEKPDVVFSFMMKPVIYGSIAAKLCGVKYIQAMIEGLGYAFIGRTKKQRLLKYVALVLYWIALKCTNRVYFLNNDDKQYFEKHIVSPRKTKRIFGIGIDLDKFPPLEQNKKHYEFLFVARLIIEKGIKEFIEGAKIVLQKYPNTKFTIVGGIDANPSSLTQKDIDKYSKTKSIEFVGEKKDVRPYIKKCCTLVLPSSYREGMPVAPMEAMSSARAIIVTDAPGCRDLVAKKSNDDKLIDGVLEGENGYLVEKENHNAVAKAMIDLIENPQKIEDMGKFGRNFAEEFLDQKKINQSLIDDILEIKKSSDL